MNLAPVVLFVYNRPWHTEQTLDALAQNELAGQSTLYIYSDGPKHLALAEDIDKITRVRRLIRSRKWCKKVVVVEARHNKGLADSIVDGVTEVVGKHGKVIVLEDDLVTSRGFLKFMNQALEHYQDDFQVMHISGYMYPADFVSRKETFFMNVLSCWGWATWKRAWSHYNHNIQDHFTYFYKNKRLVKKFDIEGHAHFYKQLEKNHDGQIYSWAVRWYASWLRAGGYSLFPEKSLVNNIGNDGSGVHGDKNKMYAVETADYINLQKESIVENRKIRKQVDMFYKRQFKKETTAKAIIKNFLKFLFKCMGFNQFKIFLRWALRKIYPEMALLENKKIDWRVLVPTIANSSISGSAMLYPPYYISECQIGDSSHIAQNGWISRTSIGMFCSIGPNLVCGRGIFPIDGISTHPIFYSTGKQNGMTFSTTDKAQERKPIRIGDHVIIGMNVVVLDGVTIGDGSVIGSGAVVSKDIPHDAIAFGNPIRILRNRFGKASMHGSRALRRSNRKTAHHA